MKPLAKALRPERVYVFHGDRMSIVDVLPRYEIKIRLEQHVTHSVELVKSPLYGKIFWINWR